MKTLKKLKLTVLACMTFNVVSSQDLHFSQFFETPLWRNPALAGIFEGDVRVQAVRRTQWNSVTNPYQTLSVNGEYKMPVGRGDDFITAGMQVLHDEAGSAGWSTNHILPVVNFHKSLSGQTNRYLSLGFMGGWVQRRIDPSKITTNTQYENGTLGEDFAATQYGFLDGSVGMSYNATLGENPANNFFVGAAYHHVTRPNNSFFNANAPLAPKMVLSAGVRFGVSDYSYMTILADRSTQSGASETVAGAMYGIKFGGDPDKPAYTLHGGGFLRWNDAFIPVIKLEWAPVSLSLSYDANISKLKTSSSGRGGFEFSLTFIGSVKRNEGYLLCPKF